MLDKDENDYRKKRSSLFVSGVSYEEFFNYKIDTRSKGKEIG